ncbi:3-ketoacyl-CoA thiolase with broad chain length specificity [Aspergillus wentii]|nr:3-ketoacyl-CoA thiolase with broad chain length specificity [Aspergillus wentii]
MYVDLVAQVVKTFFNDSEKAVIYVTDYTTNETLFDYGQDDDHGRDGDPHNYLGTGKRKWKGPAGRMSLQVTLWEPHASYARENLKLNDFVLLTNVKIRKSRVSEGIEASLHGDRMYPNKVCVRTVDAESDDRARDLLRRKKDYWKAHGGKQNLQEEIEKSTVQSANPSIPTRSLAAILSNESHQNISPDGIEYRLPFQNLCYRPLVRVVDFFPHNLEDFAVPEDAECAALSSSESDEAPDLNDTDRFYRWEWRFILLIEDGSPSPPGQPKEQMKLFVSGADAVHLLGIDAKNLRKNKSTLDILREKLFYLWGNLEEEKQKAAAEGNLNPQILKTVSSVPFTCCIKEYGVKCTHGPDKAAIEDGLGCSQEGCFGWERRFAMFQTVIHG